MIRQIQNNNQSVGVYEFVEVVQPYVCQRDMLVEWYVLLLFQYVTEYDNEGIEQ